MISGKTMGILLTRACPLRCRHCYLSSGPEHALNFEKEGLLGVIDSTASLRKYAALCFSGGEPFYREELLRIAIKRTAYHRIRPAVVTSAFWAGTYEKALKTLAGLPEIAELHISTDRFHQEFVPVDYVRNAIRAGKELRIWAITLAITGAREGEKEELGRYLGDLLPDRYIFTQHLVPLGRGALNLKMEELHWGHSDAPCDDLETPSITPSLTVLACCGPVTDLRDDHPLVAGSLKSDNLQTLLNRIESDRLLNLIRFYGPWGVSDILGQAGTPLTAHAYSCGCACDLCLEILGSREKVQVLRELLQGELGAHVERLARFEG